MLKRLVAKRKLQRKCILCGKGFKKGEVYYKFRTVINEGAIIAYEYTVCPKCKYENEQHAKRFESFQERCDHPDWAKRTRYSYMSIDYDYCGLCGLIGI